MSITEDATTRIIGLDPSLSCGVSILQLNAQDEILSIDVGVLDISCKKTLLTHGSRCNELQRLLTPLLSTPVDMVYIESYFVPLFRDPRDSKWKVNQVGVDLNYKIRGALEMLLDKQGIPYSYVAPQTWKKDIVGNGTSEKSVIKDMIESKMGFHFHPRLFSRGRCSPLALVVSSLSNLLIFLVSGGILHFGSTAVIRRALLYSECFRERSLSLLQPALVLLRLAYRTGGWVCLFLLPSPRPSPSPPKPFLLPPLHHPFLHPFLHPFRFLSGPRFALFVPDACCRHGTVVYAKWLLDRRLERERQTLCSRRADEQFELYRLCNFLELSCTWWMNTLER